MTTEVQDPVRRLAVDVLTRVEEGDFLNEVLTEFDQRVDRGSQGVHRLHFLTIGTTKWRLRLDYELDFRLPKGLDSLPGPVRSALRLGLFEMRFGNAPDHAVVNSSVEAARALGYEGLCGLVNGVLRSAARQGEPEAPAGGLEEQAVRASHPRWLLEAVQAQYGTEVVDPLTEWNNRPAPVWIRVDADRRSTQEALDHLLVYGLEGIGHTELSGYIRLPSGTDPGGIEGLREGWLTVQDPSAALAALAVGGESRRVLDLCAAPGGKTTHLVELAEAGSEIVATDADESRYARLEQSVERHGRAGVVLRPYDMVLAKEGTFDAVLVDAPCSNLGVLRRRADARWRITPEGVGHLSRIQGELLDRGGELVRAGGVLVYSTCTLLREENEDVVEKFLHRHDDYAVEALPEDVPESFRSGTGTAVSLPWRHGIDGAFVARLRRRGSG